VDIARHVYAPFDGFALVHPSLAAYSATKDDELCPALTYIAFPCFASEIPVATDVAWAKLQKAEIAWSDLERAPASAVRSGTPAKRKTKPAPRKPKRLRDVLPALSTFRFHRDQLELENWRGHVATIADGAVSTGERCVSLAGRAHARAIVTSFLQRDELPDTRGEPDPLIIDRLYALVEAASGDVVDGVEPVFIEERATGRTLARLWMKHHDRELHFEYVTEDDRMTPAVIDAAVSDAYLRVLTLHYYRGKVDKIIMRARDGAESRELAYPAK
jgi:hypothetical protein